jgi:hypothetical protein
MTVRCIDNSMNMASSTADVQAEVERRIAAGENPERCRRQAGTDRRVEGVFKWLREMPEQISRGVFTSAQRR